jgi:hypothetical protein
MKALLDWLDGKKTYLTCAAGGIALFGSWQGWWKLPPEIYGCLMALALAFLRHGVEKAGPTDH